MAPNIQNVTTW